MEITSADGKMASNLLINYNSSGHFRIIPLSPSFLLAKACVQSKCSSATKHRTNAESKKISSTNNFIMKTQLKPEWIEIKAEKFQFRKWYGAMKIRAFGKWLDCVADNSGQHWWRFPYEMYIFPNHFRYGFCFSQQSTAQSHWINQHVWRYNIL